jgi:hypothetical protein
MGPGIFTKYSKQVIRSLIVFFVLLAAIPCYFWFRNPVASESPYQEQSFLENFADGERWEYEKISLTAAREVYPTDSKAVEVILRNSTEHVELAPAVYLPEEWVLETRVDGAWRSMHTRPDTRIKNPDWEVPTEENGLEAHPAAILKQGEERVYLCSLERYYRTPLEPGLYRIVFPSFEVMNVSAETMTYTSLAAEFYIEN